MVILKGVNYASAAAGILNYTGHVFVGRINFDAQIDNFANTRQEIITKIGVPAALKLLNNALFTVAFGSNDFLDNYLSPPPIPNFQFLSPQSFVAIMISTFRVQLTVISLTTSKNSYKNICIFFVNYSNPFSGDKCVTFPNQLAHLFNTQLKTLVEELRTILKGSLFVYGDAYHIMEDIMMNYSKYGFKNPNSACCHLVGRFGGVIACGGYSIVCEDRS
ncbi:hypothetical protein RYX36_002171, partial [Vicia faba]